MTNPYGIGLMSFFFLREIMGVDRPYRTYESRTRLSFVSHSMELFEAAKLYEIPLNQKEPAAFMDTNSIGFSSSPNVQRFFSSVAKYAKSTGTDHQILGLHKPVTSLGRRWRNDHHGLVGFSPSSLQKYCCSQIGSWNPRDQVENLQKNKNICIYIQYIFIYIWNKPPSEIQPCTGQIGDIPSLPARESFGEIRTSWAILGEGGLLERGKFYQDDSDIIVCTHHFMCIT